MAATPYPAWDGFAPRLALPDGGYALSGLQPGCITPGALSDGGCALSGLRRIAPRLALPDGGYALSDLQPVASRLGRCRMAAAPYPACNGSDT